MGPPCKVNLRSDFLVFLACGPPSVLLNEVLYALGVHRPLVFLVEVNQSLVQVENQRVLLACSDRAQVRNTYVLFNALKVLRSVQPALLLLKVGLTGT